MHCRSQGSKSTRRRRFPTASCLAALVLVNSPGGSCYPSAAAFLTAGRGAQICLVGNGKSCSAKRRRSRERPEARVRSALTFLAGGRSTWRSWGVLGRGQLLEESILSFEVLRRPLQAGGGGFLAPAGTVASRERFGPGISTGRRFCMLTPAVDTGSGGGGADGGGLQAATKSAGETHLVGGGITTAATRGESVETAAPKELSKMKLADLKALYRDNGGKPGALRKAELVERLRRSFQGQTAEPGAGSPSVLSSETVGTGDLREADAANATKIATTTAPPVDEAGISSPHLLTRRGGAQNHQTSGQQLSLPANEVSNGLKMPSTGDPKDLLSSPAWARTALGVEAEQDFPEAPDDLLSRGPAAVVAAARARGVAAAAAAAAREAPGGWDLRASVMAEEARRRAEEAEAAELSRAVNGWVRSPEEARQHLRRQQQLLQEPKQFQAREENRQSHEKKWEAEEATVASIPEIVDAPPACADTAANMTAGHARPALSSSPSSAAWGSRVSRDPEHRSNSASGLRPVPGRGRGRGEAAVRDRSGAGRQVDRFNPVVTRGGGGSKKYRSEGSPVSIGGGGRRPRLMPKMPNPWARGGLGGASEGLPEEGDVVDEYLSEMMMQASDKERGASGDPLFDRERRFEGMPGASTQLYFLGTASCIPSTSRGVSCTVLRNEGDLWMFDVGEGTQVQIQRSPIKPTRITKIFITHAHGDHSFGLPGMLCLMGQNYERTPGKRVEIYGPAGLRVYLRAALRYTYSKVTAPYVVHELMDVPHLHGDVVKRPEDFHLDIEQDFRYGEQRGGRDIYPNSDGVFEIYRDEKAIVRAAPMKHGVPCVGYCVEEPDRPGRLKIEQVSPILNSHKEAIQEATGQKGVGWILGSLKAMKPGDSITLPGTDVTIHSHDAVDPPTKGRKVVILGDTCDASSMVPLAEGADVVVHEATNAFLLPIDQGKTYADVEREAIEHGHSTPVMAAAFAEKVGAKTLVLNHFSARYRGDASDASVAAMFRIERQAMRAGGLERHQVIATWDLLQLPVLAADHWEASRPRAREDDEAHATAFVERAAAWKEDQRQSAEKCSSSGETVADAASSRPPAQEGIDVASDGAGDCRSAVDDDRGINLPRQNYPRGRHQSVPVVSGKQPLRNGPRNVSKNEADDAPPPMRVKEDRDSIVDGREVEPSGDPRNR